MKVKLISFKESVEVRESTSKKGKTAGYKANIKFLPLTDLIGPVYHQAPEMICKDYDK